VRKGCNVYWREVEVHTPSVKTYFYTNIAILTYIPSHMSGDITPVITQHQPQQSSYADSPQ
jgi:hypothetical protein